MEVTGKIKKIFDLQTFSSGFTKKELILLTQEQYPQTLAIEFHQDRTELLDKFNVGDDVKISVNLRGREWTNPEGVVKYFNSIVGWRIERLDQSSETHLHLLILIQNLMTYQQMVTRKMTCHFNFRNLTFFIIKKRCLGIDIVIKNKTI